MTMTIATILILTLAAILAYDTAASLLSRRIGFKYAYASVGSLVLFCVGLGVACAAAGAWLATRA